LDTAGALSGRGQEYRRRPDAVLEMALPDPGAVETEPFTELEQAQAVLEPGGGILVGVVARVRNDRFAMEVSALIGSAALVRDLLARFDRDREPVLRRREPGGSPDRCRRRAD
jgi:hypothetical protein